MICFLSVNIAGAKGALSEAGGGRTTPAHRGGARLTRPISTGGVRPRRGKGRWRNHTRSMPRCRQSRQRSSNLLLSATEKGMQEVIEVRGLLEKQSIHLLFNEALSTINEVIQYSRQTDPDRYSGARRGGGGVRGVEIRGRS